jgi:hypothetical protein
MKRILFAAPLLVLALVSGCTSFNSSGGEDGSDQSAPIAWKDAQSIEFVTDHTTHIPNSKAVLKELNRQASTEKSGVKWERDAYGDVGELATYVDDVFLSSGEGSRGCGLWVYGFREWASEAVVGGDFEWVQEEFISGEFSDGGLGYVLIYSDTETECFKQAMNMIEGVYAPNSKVEQGIKPNPSLVIEFDDADGTMVLGNAGDAPIKLNDEFCVVTPEGAYVDTLKGRVTGTLAPGEGIRIDADFDALGYLDKDIEKQIGIGNCSRSEFRVIASLN